MGRKSFGAAAFVCLAFVGATSGGCASEQVVEEQAQATSEIRVCDPYPENPACSAPLFLQRAWELGVENGWENALLPAASILGCFTALRGVGMIANGTRTLAPRLLGRGSQVVTLLAEFEGCRQTVLYLDRIGIAQNISCFIQPQLYDRDVHACMCQNGCESTHGASSLSFIDAMNNCHCTNDAHQARCSLVGGCAEWVSNDRNDPNYCACMRPPL
jgi:hypothetical protein